MTVGLCVSRLVLAFLLKKVMLGAAVGHRSVEVQGDGR